MCLYTTQIEIKKIQKPTQAFSLCEDGKQSSPACAVAKLLRIPQPGAVIGSREPTLGR